MDGVTPTSTRTLKHRHRMIATSGPGNGLDLMLLFGDVGLPTGETVPSENGGSTFAALLAKVECCGAEVHASNEGEGEVVALPEASPQPLDLDKLLRERFADFAPPAWNHNGEQVTVAPTVEVVTDAAESSGSIESRQPFVDTSDVLASEPNADTIDSEADTSELPRTVDHAQQLEVKDEPALEIVELPERPPINVEQPWGKRLAETVAAAIKSVAVTRVKANATASAVGEPSEASNDILRHDAHFPLPILDGTESTGDDQSSDAPAIHVDSRDDATRELNALADELSSEVQHLQSSRDEVVVELQLPELGALAIEVSRDAHETEVSLHADPTLHLLIRDHLQEFVAALGESGIEFAGLDVRQQGHQQQGASHSETIRFETSEGATGRMSSSSHTPAKTGLARYQLMSVTA